MSQRRLGNYIVQQTLGEGGFSKVKLGVHAETGEKVALKILQKNKLSLNASTEKQVKREINAMARIQHPNVIRLKEVNWDMELVKKDGKKQDIILVVLELATGGELFEFLSYTGSFEEAIARTYFHQLISGVAYAHDRGVCHRDLKPENLLLDEDFVLKLADFGFSNCFESAAGALMYTECGTPGYMAPEMFNNKGYDAMKCDIWACGVILFIMMAGFPPFQKPNATDWWFQKLASNRHGLFWQAHSRNQYFSELTKDFINKILCVDPAKRISIADIIKHEWFQGPTISHQALQAELRGRKVQVDEAKNRERNELRQKQAVQEAVQRGEMGMDAVLVRDFGENDEDVPLAPPMFQPVSFNMGAKVGMMADPMAALVEGGGFGGDFGGFPEEAKSKSAPQPYDNNNVACYTRFESLADARDILGRITGVFDQMSGAQYSINNEDFKVKAKLSNKDGNVTAIAQVFADPATPGQNVVEFRRLKGDGMQYRSIYQTVRTQLNDIVIEKPQAVAAAD